MFRSTSRRSVLLATTICVAVSAITEASAHGGGGGGGGFHGGSMGGGGFHGTSAFSSVARFPATRLAPAPAAIRYTRPASVPAEVVHHTNLRPFWTYVHDSIKHGARNAGATWRRTIHDEARDPQVPYGAPHLPGPTANNGTVPLQQPTSTLPAAIHLPGPSANNGTVPLYHPSAGPLTTHPAGGLSTTPAKDAAGGSATGMAIPGANVPINPKGPSVLNPVQHAPGAAPPVAIHLPGPTANNGTVPLYHPPAVPAPGPVVVPGPTPPAPVPAPQPTMMPYPVPTESIGAAPPAGDVVVDADVAKACHWVRRTLATADGEVIRRVRVCETIEADQP